MNYLVLNHAKTTIFSHRSAAPLCCRKHVACPIINDILQDWQMIQMQRRTTCSAPTNMNMCHRSTAFYLTNWNHQTRSCGINGAYLTSSTLVQLKRGPKYIMYISTMMRNMKQLKALHLCHLSLGLCPIVWCKIHWTFSGRGERRRQRMRGRGRLPEARNIMSGTWKKCRRQSCA